MDTKFYDWQIRAYHHIKDSSAVLSAPTGAGKTLVAYLWAGLLNLDGTINPTPDASRIIFTAPIKALSNERYLDLRRMGLDVGLETGDFKRNEGASIICCTQEIYTMKYADTPGQKLIVDEFHYIFTDSSRARMYIDGIRGTDPSTQILVMSATLGGIKSVGKYLSDICGRDFVIHQARKRITELIFQPNDPVKIHEIHDALVFLFSQRGVVDLADQIARTRKRIPTESVKRIDELAKILEVKKTLPGIYKGVGIYHGSMLPKEKLLVESAFRERLLDVVCGTNALALGVNLPAQYVIFAQLVNYYNYMPITRNEFLQMSGRAGRKGLFDPGYVTFIKDSGFECGRFRTGVIFRQLMDKSSEPAVIKLSPSYGRLLRKQVLIEDEAEYIAEYSLPSQKVNTVLRELKAGMKKIDILAKRMARGANRPRFMKILAEIWYDEMEIEENLEMARLFADEGNPSALMAAKLIVQYERNYLQALLKVKRFANQLPASRRFRLMDELNKTVDNIDPTIYGFEEKLGEIEAGQPREREEVPLLSQSSKT
ncbi:MAG: DEAD/DEAH box helicase [Synergistaceae bacterium]|nr:DEAD/DEAH box helicase [Synergistaceae bacterium]